MLQRFAVAIEQIHPQRQLGVFVHPDDVAVAGTVARHHAQHFTRPIGDAGAAHGDEVVILRQTGEIGINDRRQRIDDVIASERERLQTGFEVADPAAALQHFAARAIHMQQLAERHVADHRMAIAQRLDSLLADADVGELVIERTAGAAHLLQ
ncbi:hypothetical protein AK51_11720 [Serratia nematodiphila DZ0503SBS1]|nr:hypothetical protein AK51_11720 [Serratia nematodiphila DZ0503SBS1]